MAEGDISLHGFENLNTVPDVEAYVKALEVFDGLAELQELKQQARAEVAPGMAVLDVGCGFGLETERLAGLAGAAGRVVGVDRSEAFIAEARARAAAKGLAIDYRVGDAEALDLPDHGFDVARAERVLVYLPEPEKALSEMRRVTKPGGAVALIEPDFGTNGVNSTDRSLARRVLQHECDAGVAHGWLVRDLKAMLADLGFAEVRIATRVVIFAPDLAAGYFGRLGTQAQAAGAISEAEAGAWTRDIAQLAAAHRLFGAIGYYLFTARTPG